MDSIILDDEKIGKLANEIANTIFELEMQAGVSNHRKMLRCLTFGDEYELTDAGEKRMDKLFERWKEKIITL